MEFWILGLQAHLVLFVPPPHSLCQRGLDLQLLCNPPLQPFFSHKVHNGAWLWWCWRSCRSFIELPGILARCLILYLSRFLDIRTHISHNPQELSAAVSGPLIREPDSFGSVIFTCPRRYPWHSPIDRSMSSSLPYTMAILSVLNVTVTWNSLMLQFICHHLFFEEFKVVTLVPPLWLG